MGDRIYEWRQVMSEIADTAETEPNTQTFVVSDTFAGWTLERTLLFVHAESHDTFTHFPPPPTQLWAVGLYHARNSSGSDLRPGIQDWETDWVAYGCPAWFADFGALTTTEQDLVWHADLFVDSNARRTLLQDDATCTLAYGAPSGSFLNIGTRLRPVALSWTARFLYSHPA